MTVILVDARSRTRGAHVSKQQTRANRFAQTSQVSVVRRCRDRRVAARSRVRAQSFRVFQSSVWAGSVPSYSAAVHVHLVVASRVACHPRGESCAIRHVRETVVRAVDDLRDAHLVAVVKHPAAHFASSSSSCCCSWRCCCCGSIDGLVVVVVGGGVLPSSMDESAFVIIPCSKKDRLFKVSLKTLNKEKERTFGCRFVSIFGFR